MLLGLIVILRCMVKIVDCKMYIHCKLPLVIYLDSIAEQLQIVVILEVKVYIDGNDIYYPFSNCISWTTKYVSV